MKHHRRKRGSSRAREERVADWIADQERRHATSELTLPAAIAEAGDAGPAASPDPATPQTALPATIAVNDEPDPEPSTGHSEAFHKGTV
jgi:hypothetical protein